MFAPDACPSSSRATDESTTFATGAKKSAMPTPERMNGITSAAVRRRRRRDRGDPREPGRLERQPEPHQPVAADPVGESAGDRRDEDRHRRPRQDPQAGLQRRVPLHGLEELGEQEDRAEHPEEHEEARDVRQRERPVAEEAHRQHRMRRPELPQDERAEHREPGDECTDDLGRAPADGVAAHEAPDDPEQAGAGERDARQVERVAGPCDSRRRSSASGASTRPIGTFSQKIQCHEMPETTAPPISGPIATARPLIPPHAPRASPRRSGGTAAERIVSVSGITIAPPTPCTARAASSAPIDGASAAAAEASVKIVSPIVNMRRRPNRSPSAAPVRSSTAKVSV